MGFFFQDRDGLAGEQGIPLEQHRQAIPARPSKHRLHESEASTWQKEPLLNFERSLKVTDKCKDCAEELRATESVLLCCGSSSGGEKSMGGWLFPGQRARLAAAAGEAEGKEEWVVGV